MSKKKEMPTPSTSFDAVAPEFVNSICADATEYRKKNDSRAVKNAYIDKTRHGLIQ